MLAILCIAAVIAAVSVYDYLNTKSWQQVTSSTRNETVFKQRNREYGAYVMRRDYNRNLILIMGGMLGGLGVLYAATYNGNEIQMVAESPNDEFVTTEIIIPKKPEIKQEKIKSAPAVIPPLSTVIHEPVVVDTPVDQPINIPDDKLTDGDPNGKGIPTDVDQGGTGIGEDVGTRETNIDLPAPPAEPEKFPPFPAEFPGGSPALRNYLEKELHFPEIAYELGVDGKCYLQFIVSETGEISKVEIQRGIEGCEACDKEAVRVIRKMPHWRPARNDNNKPVKSIFNIPIRFVAR